jgi:arylamine N-acetyltransferase
VAGYLSRLGVDLDGPPSTEGLRRLHRAHAERVTPEERDRLWERVRSRHETWLAAGRP